MTAARPSLLVALKRHAVCDVQMASCPCSLHDSSRFAASPPCIKCCITSRHHNPPPTCAAAKAGREELEEVGEGGGIGAQLQLSNIAGATAGTNHTRKENFKPQILPKVCMRMGRQRQRAVACRQGGCG